MSDALHREYVQALEAENAQLRERVRQLEEKHGYYFHAPAILGLTSSESKVLGALMARDIATKDHLMLTLYSHLPFVEAEIKIVDVYVCKIRKKVKPYKVEIETVWGRGYTMPAASKAIITQMLTPEPVQ